MRLRGQLVPVAALSPEMCDAMFTLMDRYFENVNPVTFTADLQQKQWAILLFDPKKGSDPLNSKGQTPFSDPDELCGFSTQVLLEVSVAGRPVRALFSGDTIVARDRWGDPALAHVWGRLALSLIDRYADVELHWFLISKGYKTYRFLPLFFHEFYPRVSAPTPAWAKDVIDALARFKYPDSYDAGAGVIRAGANKDRLRPGVAEITSERQRDSHVRFFLGRNPGHARGDELCCIAPLTRANFTAAAYRVIRPEPVLAEVGQ